MTQLASEPRKKKPEPKGPPRSVLQEGDDIALATTMITMGARLQILEIETGLSHERLARLYREIHGCSAPRGMLPFSVDWFMTWKANIHSSVFYSIYRFLEEHGNLKGAAALVKAYSLYRENEDFQDAEEPILSFTRAWMLLRFIKGGVLRTSTCIECRMDHVTHAEQLQHNFVCPVCRPPARVKGMLNKSRLDMGMQASAAG